MPRNTNIKLSICIATLNRSTYLEKILDAITQQYQDGIEIVIVDGASTDNTSNVVGNIQRNFSNIQYIKLDEKGGIDRDFSLAVEKANGEFCWLLPDDDLIKPNAIESILAMIDHKTNLIVVNAEIRSEDLGILLKQKTVPIDDDINYQQQDYDQFFVLIANYMSFIGCVVIRKSLWDERQKEQYFGSWFVHMGVIFQDYIGGVKIMAEPMIMIRYGNASWTSKSFEISLFKWPELIWSFQIISDDAKSNVVKRHPWKSLARLLLFRARGVYGKLEYERYLINKLSFPQKQLFYMGAILPGILLNFLFLFYFNVMRFHYKDWKMHVFDLKSSKYYFKF